MACGSWWSWWGLVRTSLVFGAAVSSSCKRWSMRIGSLLPDQEFAVAAFCVASGRASTRAKAQRRLEDHRRSCISTHPLPSGTDTTVPPTGVRIRHLTSIGPGSAAPTMIHDASHDPYAKEVLQKNAKLESMFELLLEDFLDLQELGVDRAMMRDPV